MNRHRRTRQKKSKLPSTAMTHHHLQQKRSQNMQEAETTVTKPSSTHDSFDFASLAVQPKLTVGAPNDKYEQEADKVAAQVVKQINAPQSSTQDIQRETPQEEEALQMKPMLQRMGHEGGDVSSDIESSIQGARGGGAALEPRLQDQMGQAMGADFSGVRVHTDARSDQLNQSIQAKAFTTGNDVFFRQGAYDPTSQGGQALIAHELTHVVQQTGAVQRSAHKKISQTGDRIQRDDEIVGDVDLSGFSDKATKTSLGGSQPSLLEEAEKQTTTSVDTGSVTTTETSSKAFAGCGTAAQKIVECDGDTLKEAFQALARAGAFGEAAAKKEIETSSGVKASMEGTASGFAGVEGEVVSVRVRDAIEGLTIMARATAKAGVGFDLAGVLQVSKEVGGVELSAKLESKLSGFAGVMAEAKGKFNISATGMAMEGKVCVMAGAKSEGEVTATLQAGDLGFDGQAKYEALAGAEAGAEGKLEIGLDGIAVTGKAECFAGAKVKGSAATSMTYKGKVLIKISGELEASAGVGGSIEGEFSIKGGKLVLGGKLAGTLGIGGGAGAKVEIDFKEIAKAIFSIIKDKVVSKALDNKSISDEDRESAEDLTPEEKDKIEQDLYEAVHPHLDAYGKKKRKLATSTNFLGNKKASSLVKRKKVQSIIDDKIRKNPALAEHLKYKFTDATLQKAVLDAFGDQLKDGELIIQAGVLRAFGVKKVSEL